MYLSYALPCHYGSIILDTTFWTSTFDSFKCKYVCSIRPEPMHCPKKTSLVCTVWGWVCTDSFKTVTKPATVAIECWKLNVENWMLPIECRQLNVNNWMLTIESWQLIFLQYWILTIEYWQLNVKYWMLNIECGN